MSEREKNGIERVASSRGFAETVAHLESLIVKRGLTLFAKIDFSGDAKRAGPEMPPTQLLIFGNPKAGTPVMVAVPNAALDLPLKALISQDRNGKVWVNYNAPEYLRERHGIPADLLKNVSGVGALVEAALGKGA